MARDHTWKSESKSGQRVGEPSSGRATVARREEPVAAIEEECCFSDAVQRLAAEGFPHRIPDGQGSDKHGRRDRRRQHDTQVMLCMEDQASPAEECRCQFHESQTVLGPGPLKR